MDWILGVVFLVSIGFLVIIAEIARKKKNITPELTRKFVHIITGLFIALTPFIFQSHHPILAIALLFILLNYIAIRKGVFKSIHSTDRESYGTVFYPVAFFILTSLLWQNNKVVLITSFLILALGDALASIVGKKIKEPYQFTFGEEPKSLQGSLTMFVSTIIIVFFCIYFLGFIDTINLSVAHSLLIAIITAIVATSCEAVSYKGSDNLTVPFGAAFTLHFMITHCPHYWGFILGVSLALLIALISYRLKFLDGGGSVATFLLGTVVFGTGGWKFALPILSFFILSSLLSKIGKQHKQKLSDTFQKSSQRDLWQVLANGGMAGLIVLLWNYFPNDLWYYMYAGSLAAATADTWGTEIGVFSKINPRNIINFKSVPVGASGGITILGTSGALLGSFVIAGIAGIFLKNINIILLVAICGLLGSIVDSIVGATVQAQYQCLKCYKVTEKTIHCDGRKTHLITGWRVIDNDVVNSICTFSAAVFVWIGVKIFF